MLTVTAPVHAEQAGPSCVLGSHRINESSGLIRSRQFEGIYWTHNDSSDTPRIFAIRQDGSLVREIELQGAKNIDWEDIALDDAGNLYIADIGNNLNMRRDLCVYRLREPDPTKPGPARVDRRIAFRYPDQKAYPDRKRMNFDSEAIFYARGHLYLLSKHRSDTKTVLYRFPSLTADKEHVLVRVGEFDVGGRQVRFGGQVSGADVTDDGRYLAVLTYHALLLFERPKNSDNYLAGFKKGVAFDMKVTQQCEGIAWDGGTGLWFTNEDGVVHRIPNVFDETLRCYPSNSRHCARIEELLGRTFSRPDQPRSSGVKLGRGVQ